MYFLTRDQEAISALDANGENIHAPDIVCISFIEHPQIPDSQFPGCQRIRGGAASAGAFPGMAHTALGWHLEGSPDTERLA
ncbi:MAG: hypothetical protein ACRD88_03130, partial [Terriglobia bacterium]